MLLSFRQSVVCYHVYGSGSQVVLCLHGYGERGRHFSFLEKIPELADYCFIAPDLPWHGDTEWKEGLDWPSEDLGEIVSAVLKAEGLDVVKNIGVIGFSLGGRIALDFYQRQPIPVDKLVLLAPDGLKVNFWYWLSTQTWLGRNLFRWTMKHPGWLFALLKLGSRLRLVNTSIFKFVNYYIGDHHAREMLYYRWVGLRKFKPNKSQCRQLIQKLRTPVRLIYGKFDRIILPNKGIAFKKGLEEFVTITEIASGHQVLHEKYGKEIAAALID